MLIIRHQSGPCAGQEYPVDPKTDRVVFGRGRDCQIGYPPEATIVSREHFALVRKPPGPTGHWTIELFGDPFVAVNGVAADPGQKATNGAVFELGKRGGPSFKLLIEPDRATDNLPITERQEQDKGPRAVAARARRLALAGVALAIVVGIGASYYYFSTRNLTIGSDVRDQLVRSAFLVTTPTSGGTAWPVATRLLATNAHVAELFQELQPGEKMLVRSPGKNGKDYEVVGYRIHPGYRALTDFLDKDPVRRNAVKLFVPGYDVALLGVAEDLPTNAILKLASADEVRALKAGTVVASAGYPIEGVVGSPAQSYGATPVLHVGTVTGITDFFFLPADVEQSRLVHHDLPSAGGASGSAIVSHGGHVVALLNAGNHYHPGAGQARVPSGVLINYAQRVDLLRDLLDGKADGRLRQDQAYWDGQISTFPRGPDIVANFVVSRIRDREKNPRISLVKLSEETATLSEQSREQKLASGVQRQAEHAIKLAAGSDYVLIAYAYDDTPVEIWLYDGNRELAHDANKIYAWARYKAGADMTLSAWVISPEDKNVTYTLQVLKVQTNGAAGS